MLLVTVLVLCVSLVWGQDDADVLILGAGMAGQVAAAYFMKNNVSFLLIEGAAEPGGRIKSVQFGGRMIELGSPGIYATNATIEEMVEKYNISGMYANFESVVVRKPDGTQPDAEADAAWEKLATAEEKVTSLYEEVKAGKIPDMSVRVALEMGGWMPKSPVEDVIEIYDYDYEFAKIPEEISTYGIKSVEHLAKTPFFSNDQRGLQNILQMIPRDDPRLRLNEEVTNITYTDSSVSVKTKSGKTFTGKYAIVTFSVGVLKSKSVTFDPALPDWKLSTILSTSMDDYTQIYVSFPMGTTPYWTSNQFILYASNRRNYYPVVWNLVADNFSPIGKPMIVFHAFGEEARRVQREDKAAVQAEITQVLKNMFGTSVAVPDDIYMTRWTSNPLYLGSFSSRQIGANNNPMFLDALMSPVGRVHFAGDAYDDMADGFLVGALHSGNATAMKVMDCMMGKKCHSFNADDYKPKPPPTCGGATTSASVLFMVTCALALLL